MPTEILDPEIFPPAPAQGAICIESRIGDDRINDLLDADQRPEDPSRPSPANAAFLATLDGSCRTPIAGYAICEGDPIRFSGMILTPDGSNQHSVTIDGTAATPQHLARAPARTSARAPAAASSTTGADARCACSSPGRSLRGERTAERLRHMGHEPVLLPLSRPVHDRKAAIEGLARSNGPIAITSAEAVRALSSIGRGHQTPSPAASVLRLAAPARRQLKRSASQSVSASVRRRGATGRTDRASHAGDSHLSCRVAARRDI